MPKWAKHLLWALIALILLAHWRAVGVWIGELCRGIGNLFDSDMFRFNDPVYRFAVFGVLIVALVALAALYFNNRPGKDQ